MNRLKELDFGSSAPSRATAEQGERTTRLRRMLAPRSIAVVGASQRPGQPGGRLVQRLQQYGFAGNVAVVNPNRDSAHGIASYPTLSAVPFQIDTVVLAIARDQVIDTLWECARLGVAGVVIISSGFSEIGRPEGVAAQREIADFCARTGVRVLGPNSVGFFNIRDAAALTFTSLIDRNVGFAGRVEQGSTAILSQSGGIGFGLFVSCLRYDLQCGLVMHTGNEVDIDLADCLDIVADDEAIKCVVMFAESIRRLGDFRRAAGAVKAAGKTMIMIRVGTSAPGRRAAESHTAQLASDNRLADAIFHELGILRARDQDEAAALVIADRARWQHAHHGTSIGIVTMSGGAGVWLADACADAGLQVPGFDDITQAKFDHVIPSYGSAKNPIDMTASANTSVDGKTSLVETVRLLSEQQDIDHVFISSVVNTEPHALKMREEFLNVLATSRRPVTILSPSGACDLALQYAGELNLPLFTSPYRAAWATKELMKRDGSVCSGAERDRPAWLMGAMQCFFDRDKPSEFAGKQLFASLGFAVPAGVLAADAGTALRGAEKLGFPVALKIHSGAVTHKARVGGVTINLKDSQAFNLAFERMQEALRSQGLGADEYLVEKMAVGTGEYIVGAMVDPDLGPLVLFGRGGTDVEATDDALIRIAPLSRAQAEQLVLTVDPGLGEDDRQPGAKESRSIIDLVWTVSWLASHWRASLSQLELNPVVIAASGAPIILDALIINQAPPAAPTLDQGRDQSRQPGNGSSVDQAASKSEMDA